MSFTEFDSSSKSHETKQHEEPRLPTRRGDWDDLPSKPADKPFPSFFSRMFHRRNGDGRTSSRLWIRRAFIALGLFIVIAIGGVIGVSAWLRHSLHASLPQLDGDLHVAGLHGPVSVTRDAQGVPSLQAANLDDVLFAQGFVTAQDRLWQMDVLRRHAAGELAEVLGNKLIEHDRMQRVLQIRAAADRAVVVLAPEQLHQLQAYANGVNAFIEQSGDRLPVEFHLLHYKPAPWTPRDTILVSLSMFQDLSTGFPVKMKREVLSAHLSAQLVADLYPVGSWRDHPPTQPPPDLTTPKPEIEEIPLDDTQVRVDAPKLADPRDVLKVANELQGSTCDDCRTGSNNWAVSGVHSASGFPLLSNDMHLSLSVPDIWYEAGLHCPAVDGNPALDVVGFTLPGAPFVIVGRNAHVAWGFTNLVGDVQDIRIEHTRESGSGTEYQKPDGTWAAVGHVSETIHVRGGRDVLIDVPTTATKIGGTEITTPVISQLYPSEKRVLSLVWTAYDPLNLAVPFFNADTASNGASLVTAFAALGGPSLNLVYADDAKHIGYHTIGRIPVRGPAERQTRVITNPFAPAEDNQEKGPTPEKEEDSEEPTTPQTSSFAPLNFGHPFLIDAAYRPARQRVKPQRKAAPKEAPEPPVKEEPIKPVPAPLDYTIGSAISSVPVDALDAGQQWSGYIPFDQLPSVVDPANGILATANARVTPNDYPYFISNNWAPPYRVERINKLLAGRNGLKPGDMLALQNDVHSELDRVIAERLTYAVDHASAAALGHDAKRLHQAADILRAWNGEMSSDSAAAAIVMAFRDVFWSTLLAPQIAAHDHMRRSDDAKEFTALYQWGEESVALESLLQHTPRHWLPPGVASWNDLLATTLLRGIANARAPGNLSKWRYGAEHPVEIAHPILSQSSVLRRLMGTSGGTGRHETGGDTETIRAAGLHFGPSERFDADLANTDTAIGNITTGQSGNPASQWYLDQFVPWLRGTSFALPLHPAGGPHTLTLTLTP